jgi:hypothetical protein
MKKLFLMIAFAGMVGSVSAVTTGDDKDKDKKGEKKECCKKAEGKACSGEKKEGCAKGEAKACCKKDANHTSNTTNNTEEKKQ